jgi:hypothetical protein
LTSAAAEAAGRVAAMGRTWVTKPAW